MSDVDKLLAQKPYSTDPKYHEEFAHVEGARYLCPMPRPDGQWRIGIWDGDLLAASPEHGTFIAVLDIKGAFHGWQEIVIA